MTNQRRIIILIVTLLTCARAFAQGDSTLEALQQIPTKYISTVEKKIDKYTARINSKTEKTLKKLSKWEEKIRNLLEKANPDLARRLFASSQLTFSSMLQRYQSGENVIKNYKAKYDHYTDRLYVHLKYLDSQKSNLDKRLLQPLAETRDKLDSLSVDANNIEALQKLVKERKKQLIDAAFRAIGKNKYLTKISKETWYYAETMHNYRAIFNEPAKAEKLVRDALNQVPGFQNFLQKNNQLASIFGLSAEGAAGSMGSSQPIIGLQSRTGVQNALRASIGNNTNIQQMVQQNIQQAQAEINKLKNDLIKKGGTGNELSMPDFKPNMQKTKTFWQRIEYGADVQFAKHNSLLPTTSDISLSAGYKLDDKKIVGVGASYKLGLGSIDNIKLTNQGIGLRSYLDWKMKKGIFISGGFEMNYNSAIRETNIENAEPWQQSALIGVTKKIKVNARWFKATKLQLLFDFLSQQHKPVSQPVLFRMGYNF